jgi:hypothetical protein
MALLETPIKSNDEAATRRSNDVMGSMLRELGMTDDCQLGTLTRNASGRRIRTSSLAKRVEWDRLPPGRKRQGPQRGPCMRSSFQRNGSSLA